MAGTHPSCPSPDGRGWGHVGTAAAPLHPPLQGHPFSFPCIYHSLLGFQSPSSLVHLCSFFPRFFLHRLAKAPCCSCRHQGCSSSRGRLLAECGFAFHSGNENRKSQLMPSALQPSEMEQRGWKMHAFMQVGDAQVSQR